MYRGQRSCRCRRQHQNATVRHRRLDRRGLTRRHAMTAERFSIDDRLTSVLPSLYEKIRDSAPRPRKARVRRLLGVIIHATASGARIGELCHLVDPETGRRVMAEVIGILDEVAVLTPIGDLFGLSSVTEVMPTGTELLAPVGDRLLGRVINALGDPIDGEPLPTDI